MIKKKLIKGFLIIFCFSVITTATAYAVFTTQSVNKGNKLSAGTVVLNVDTNNQQSGVQADSLFNQSDLKPGFSTIKAIVVRNDGTLPLKYTSFSVKESGDDALFSIFQLEIRTQNGELQYKGLLSDFKGLNTTRNLLSGANESLYFTISLPDNLDSALQNKTVSFDIIFSAEQSQ